MVYGFFVQKSQLLSQGIEFPEWSTLKSSSALLYLGRKGSSVLLGLRGSSALFLFLTKKQDQYFLWRK
jgi:hypothetical protein